MHLSFKDRQENQSKGTTPLITLKRKLLTSCGMIDPFVLLYLARTSTIPLFQNCCQNRIVLLKEEDFSDQQHRSESRFNPSLLT
jgi:hypothetical protein